MSNMNKYRKNKNIIYIIICVLISLGIELFIFNYSAWRSLTNESVSIAENVVTDETGHFEADIDNLNIKIKNVNVKIRSLCNAESVTSQILISDEGDFYQYALPEFRIVPEVLSTGFTNIYPYGKVHSLKITLDVPEGSEAEIEKIEYNYRKPFDLKMARIFILSLLLVFLTYVWNENVLILTDITDTDVNEKPTGKVNILQKHCILGECRRKDVSQTLVTFAVIVVLIILGRGMSTSNNKMVSCPWPHHKQYQELAISLSNGSVALINKEVSEELLKKDNPYDTSALLAEGIPYEMDYAFYEGKYYVYFGIIPELMLYYPYYKITNGQLSNYNAQLVNYIVLILGIFLTIWEICFKYGKRKDKCNISYITYLFLAVAMTLFSNNIYLISRPDIYNVPILAAISFTWLGFGMWLHGLSKEIGKNEARIALLMGSFCEASVVGCRPQLILYSLVGIFLFLLCFDGEKCSLKNRCIFRKDTVIETILLICPFVIIGIIICGYNYLRFGSVFDFGATYSLTSNDMNHRGFSFDRLLRGLFAFILQPVTLTLDFPYLTSSLLESGYMGKNLTEFMFGGSLVTNPLLLVIFAPLFGKRRKGMEDRKGLLSKETKVICLVLVIAAAVIACFDINGAGILYRYTCDFIPGLMLAACIMWVSLFAGCNRDNVYLGRLFAVAVIIGIAYSFLLFMSSGGGIGLYEDSICLYEHIREYFRL